jgi:hypothetical protein
MDKIIEVNNTQVPDSDQDEIESKKYIYHFDYPLLNESGYIEICSDKIVLLFPSKPNKSMPNAINVSQNISVYINNQLRFSYEWLPIYTLYDLYKIKDMIIKTLNEYTTMIDMNIPKKDIYIPYYCNEILTEKKNSFFEINCFENCNNTTFDIIISKEKKIINNFNQTKFINLQIFIGENLIFCGERDLLNYNVPVRDIHYIINMMISKLTK